jgi:hypothetical protein
MRGSCASHRSLQVPEVAGSTHEALGLVLEAAEGQVAATAQQPSNSTRCVIVVNHQRVCGLVADRAPTRLPPPHRLVRLGVDTKTSTPMPSSTLPSERIGSHRSDELISPSLMALPFLGCPTRLAQRVSAQATPGLLRELIQVELAPAVPARLGNDQLVLRCSRSWQRGSGTTVPPMGEHLFPIRWDRGCRSVGQPAAERVGFEPTDPCGSTVFKTVAFVRSATAPGARLPGSPSAGCGSAGR